MKLTLLECLIKKPLVLMGDSRSRQLTFAIAQMLKKETKGIGWNVETRPYKQPYNPKDHIWIYITPTRLIVRNNSYLTLPGFEYPVLSHMWNSRFQAPYEWLTLYTWLVLIKPQLVFNCVFCRAEFEVFKDATPTVVLGGAALHMTYYKPDIGRQLFTRDLPHTITALQRLKPLKPNIVFMLEFYPQIHPLVNL